jgi:hypothetical protein
VPEIGQDRGRSAFIEAARAAEEAAGVEKDWRTEGEQPRNEDGTFAPKAAAEEAAPVVDEQPIVVEETPAEALLAGKYKNVDALEAAHVELQALLDRQGASLGEERALRAAYEERLVALEASVNAPPRQQITGDFIEQNPAQAAQVAYEQGDRAALGAAYQQWALEDPAAAATWVGERRLQEERQSWQEEQKRLRAELEQRFAPIQQQNEQAVLAQGVQALPETVRTFLADAPAVQSLANEFPTLGETIIGGSPAAKLNAIQALYDIHRGRTADTLTTAATDVARTVAQEAQAARDEAYVASSTASQEESLTWEQQEQARLLEYARQKSTPFGGGLVRPGK